MKKEDIFISWIIEKQHKNTYKHWKHFFQSYRRSLKQERSIDLKVKFATNSKAHAYDFLLKTKYAVEKVCLKHTNFVLNLLMLDCQSSFIKITFCFWLPSSECIQRKNQVFWELYGKHIKKLVYHPEDFIF